MVDKIFLDMSKCPDCGRIQNPPRDIENPELHYCTNEEDCESYIFFNNRSKKAQWYNPNWD